MNALTNNTATLFRRYLWLLDVIYSAGRITLDEIRVRWQRNEMSGGEELPRKTFENHRKAVEDTTSNAATTWCATICDAGCWKPSP